MNIRRTARSKTSNARYRILQRLMASPGLLVTHQALEFAVYGGQIDGGPDAAKSSIRVMICHLRRSLPPGTITNVFGLGYRLAPGVLPPLPAMDDAHVVLAMTPADERAIRASIRQARQAAGLAA